MAPSVARSAAPSAAVTFVSHGTNADDAASSVGSVFTTGAVEGAAAYTQTYTLFVSLSLSFFYPLPVTNANNAASSLCSVFSTTAMQGAITHVYFDWCTYTYTHRHTHYVKHTLSF